MNIYCIFLDSPLTVFVMNASGKWTVKTVNALKGLDNTNTIDAFDLSSTADAVYEVVFVQ